MKYTAKKEQDPLSRLGLALGIAIGLLLIGFNNNDIYTYGERIHTGKQELGLELGYEKPDHPEKRKLETYVCAKRVYFCNDNFIDTILRHSDNYGIPPAFVLSIGVWEAPRTVSWGGLCSFGYDSCNTRFRTFDDEVATVTKTLHRYGGSLYDKYSIWRTGRVGDTAWETKRVLDLMGVISSY